MMFVVSKSLMPHILPHSTSQGGLLPEKGLLGVKAWLQATEEITSRPAGADQHSLKS